MSGTERWFDKERENINVSILNNSYQTLKDKLNYKYVSFRKPVYRLVIGKNVYVMCTTFSEIVYSFMYQI